MDVLIQRKSQGFLRNSARMSYHYLGSAHQKDKGKQSQRFGSNFNCLNFKKFQKNFAPVKTPISMGNVGEKVPMQFRLSCKIFQKLKVFAILDPDHVIQVILFCWKKY